VQPWPWLDVGANLSCAVGTIGAFAVAIPAAQPHREERRDHQTAAVMAVASWAPARKYLDEAATLPLAGPGFAHDKTLSYNDASTAIVGS
jgi:hypothetical protein